MAIYNRTNTGTATQGGESQSASVSFDATDSLPLTITKTVDKPGEYYFNGDTIIFTITLTLIGTAALNQITFTDTIPDIVSFTAANITISGTHGLVTVTGQDVMIENLVLNSGQPTNVITITGTIVV